MNQDDTPWQYKPDDNAASVPDEPVGGPDALHRPKSQDTVSWEAAEFVEHHHGPGWYAALIVTTAVLAGIVYLATRDYFATGIIIIVGIIVWVFAGHKPSKVQYEINSSGLAINGKNYAYGSYKSFSITREGSLSSVNLIPLKRFMPPVSAYFEPQDEDKITETLGEYLPYEDGRTDVVDKISRRLRL